MITLVQSLVTARIKNESKTNWRSSQAQAKLPQIFFLFQESIDLHARSGNHAPPIFYHSLACFILQKPMIIVNALRQNFDNAIKIGRKKSQSVLSLVIRAILHNTPFANIVKNLQTIPQKFKTTRTHYFISQLSYLNISPINGQSTFWWPLPDNLIEWTFLNAELFKNFFNRKKQIIKKILHDSAS